MINEQLRQKYWNGSIKLEEKAIYLEQMTKEEMFSEYDKTVTILSATISKSEAVSFADFLMDSWISVSRGIEDLEYRKNFFGFNKQKYEVLKAGLN